MPRIIALALLTTVLVASPSVADQRASITLSYRDINPNTPDGARLLLVRIEQAATTVCGGDPWKRQYKFDETIREAGDFQKCMAATVGQAVAAINVPLVRQAYDGYVRNSQTMAAR